LWKSSITISHISHENIMSKFIMALNLSKRKKNILKILPCMENGNVKYIWLKMLVFTVINV